MRWSSFCDALRQPCIIYTDTTMALSGINKDYWRSLGGECHRCYISDPRVVRAAKTQDSFNGRCRYRYRRGGEKQTLLFR